MVRHDLLPGAISPAPRGVPEAAAPTALIAARGLPPSHPAGVKAAASGAVDLAPVATTANQDLLAADGAEEEAAAAAVVEIATAPEAAFPWTRSASGAIMPLQSCSGTVWGAAPRSLPSSVGAAPGPTIDSDCSVSGAAPSASSAQDSPPAPTDPRVDPMGPQGPPVPSASLRADRAPLRGRVPPMDYRDNPLPSAQIAPAAE